MDKNKKDLMVLIGIIFIGINYAIYTYFIRSQLQDVQQVKIIYIQKKQKLTELSGKKETIKVKENEVEKLKKQTSDFDNKVPLEVNTPQLIYDFYTGCKNYDVYGESVVFQLLNQEGTSNNQNKVTNEDIDKNTSENFFTLTIELKVMGDREKIENFIKNLDNLTARKLNVRSIAIAVIEENNLNNLENQGLVVDTSTENKLSADVIFSQYIQKNEKDSMKKNYSYEFYDTQKEGFKNISDMFK